MATYKKLPPFVDETLGVRKISDNGTESFVPNDPKNKDWREYQAWLGKGNLPTEDAAEKVQYEADLARQETRKNRKTAMRELIKKPTLTNGEQVQLLLELAKEVFGE